MSHDPHTIPVRKAATVVVLRQRERPEVLMLRRNARSVFVGDMWVFPGGAVDAGDHADDVRGRLEGLHTVAHHSQMSEQDAGAHWAAVLRETYEEAGLLLGRSRDGRPWTDRELVEHVGWRDALNAGSTELWDFLESTDVVLDASLVRYIARFITPVGPPRRYDARFFIAPVPEGQTASIDDDEAVGHEWMNPAEVLDRYIAGDMVMMTPTVAVLRRLARYGTVDDALAVADSPAPSMRMRLREGVTDLERIVFPGEDGYDDADGAEFGSMRI